MAARLAPRQYVTSSTFDALNRATELRLPAEPGRQEARPVLRPRYNRAGALAQVSLDGEVLITQLAYNARGQRLLLARGNGLLTRYAYDPVLFRLRRLRTEGYQATDLTLTPRSGTTRQDTLYAYDLAGNITTLTERAPQSGVGGTDELACGFTYDALYRLLSATGRENQPTAARPWQQSTRADGVASTTAYTQRYTYDKLGNIQQLRHVASNSADSFTRRFDYGRGATNYLQQVALAGAQVAYQYDAAGNVSQENGARHSQWDAADQLRQFATWTGAGTAPTLLAYYVYAGGQRVKKLTQTSADTWQVTVYAAGGFEHRYEVSQGRLAGEQTQVAVLDGQHRLYQRRTGDALGDQRPDKLYALDDHLGSAAALTDATGGLVSREEYYPFGETSFGSTAKQRYRFCGKELDEESGLYYYGMRYYAAWLCRFVSVDPLADEYTYYTPYQYAGNKPIIAVDIDGLEADVDTSQQATRGTPENPIPLDGVSVIGCKPQVDQVKPAPSGMDDWYMADRKKNGLSGTNAASEPSTLQSLQPAIDNLTPKGKYGKMATATSAVLLEDDATGWGTIDDLLIPFLFGAAYLADRHRADDAPLVVPLDIAVPKTEDKEEFRIALGLDIKEEAANFTFRTGAFYYNTPGHEWGDVTMTPAENMAVITALGNMPNVTFHFNLTGHKDRAGRYTRIDDPTNYNVWKAKGRTIQEYMLVRRMFPNKTTFYMRSGSIYKQVQPNF